MKHRVAALTIAFLLASISDSAAQPFGWFAGTSGVDVVNLATGTTVLSANAPTGLQVGDGAIDSVSGHYLAVTNIGTFRVRLSPPVLEPGMLPYAGAKLRLSPNSETLVVCSEAPTQCRWIRRSDEALLATFVGSAEFAPDNSLIILARTSVTGPYVLRRFEPSTASTPVWTIDLGTDLVASFGVGGTRLVVRSLDANYQSRLRVFETSTGNSSGETALPTTAAQAIAGTRLYVFYSNNGRQRLARYSLETLVANLDVELPIAVLTMGIHAVRVSADGRRLYVQRVLGGRFPIAVLETYDAETLEILHHRGVGPSRLHLAVTPDPICPFTVIPSQYAPSVVAPAQGGVIELRVDTEARCGPWTVSTGSQHQLTALLGPATRTGASTIHVAVAANTPTSSVASSVLVSGIPYSIYHAAESLPPLAPVDARIRLDAHTATATWSVNEGPLIAGFHVFASVASGIPQLVDQLPATARSWTPGALPAGNYVVQIRAFNAVGNGPMSDPVTFGVGATQISAAPTNLRADGRGTYLRLTWEASPGPPFASRYVIEAAAGAGARTAIAQTADSFPEHVLHNVPPGTWSFAVRAVNDAGTSGASNVVTATTTPCAAAPDPPRNFSSVVTENIVTFSWDVPATGADGFIVEAGSIVGAADLARLRLPASTTRLNAPAPSGAYALRVRGVNQCGESGPSTERIIKVQ